MDYTSNPETNQHPNAHDYEQLDAMYSHLDAASLPFDGMAASMMRAPSMSEILADAGQWGTPIGFDGKGRPNLFELVIGTSANGDVERIFTHVFWVPVAINDVPGAPGRSTESSSPTSSGTDEAPPSRRGFSFAARNRRDVIRTTPGNRPD